MSGNEARGKETSGKEKNRAVGWRVVENQEFACK